jgi:opacity protein-like surface antigen
MTKTLGSACLLVVLMAPAASAQSSIRARGYVGVTSNFLAAKATFDAVAGKTNLAGFEAGGAVDGLWRSLFVEVGFSRQKVEGQRVFRSGGITYALGVPLSVTMAPVDISAGWRFSLGRIRPYAGGGLTMLSYKEESDFAEAGDNVSEQKLGGTIVGGVDVPVASRIYVGGVIRYRSVGGILGAGGISQDFGEDNAGGLSVGARISVGL